MIIPVILSGGSGTRLWPLSRPARPKQLLPMLGENTMLRSTIERAAGLRDVGPPLVVCNVDHHFLVAAELEATGNDPGRVLLEPVGRNTAAAAAGAALTTPDRDDILLVLPADHLIEDVAAFAAAVEHGAHHAAKGRLVTFGIVPTRPETGYGYIQMGDTLDDRTRRVGAFVEKPDPETAERYVADGDHVWNSGMFMFTSLAYLDELSVHAPSVVDAVGRAVEAAEGPLLGEAAFASSPSISIDYAVMEHTTNAVVVPLDAGWSDVGSWEAIWEASRRDREGNATVGDVIAIGSSNSYVRSAGRLIAAVGVEDMVIVETPDAFLVASKERSQDVKAVVEALIDAGRPEAERSTSEVRPWGAFRVLETGEGFQVKHLTVAPGRRFSLQRHHQRAERWTVINGTGVVTIGDDRVAVAKGDTVSIGVGVLHRAECDGSVALELIEVQIGDYLGEDDIERLEDDFGRT